MKTEVATGAGLAAAALAGVRWLRVAQREHYLPGSATRFALRWWRLGANRVLAVAVVLGIVLSPWSPLSAVVACGAVAAGPFGLSLRGRTSKLAWTRRLRTLAAVWAVLELVIVGVGLAAGAGPTVAVLSAALTPVLVDAALALTAPVERRLVQPFVERATRRLEEIHPTVVAITGSYGKTTTKGYVAHLLSATKSVVATPASFNNRAGLARAVNEHLTPGTEVFVAEMGTYGPGEIAELCSWCPPDVSVITAIGPVHLERMGSEENIAAAKAEILEKAWLAVLNVDYPLLAALADKRAAAGQRVLRCSGSGEHGADVRVVDGEVRAGGRALGRLPGPAVHAGNAACAVAVALELGVPDELLAGRLATLPTAEHRLSVATSAKGAQVLDDTYNANPAGAASALAALARHGEPDHRRVVVTPGMVELGSRQHEENARFARAAAGVATHLVVVGHTNRPALLEGAGSGGAEVVAVETREQAVAWVREHLSEGDAVLYENDLPDHFP
ncbi:MAG TPA: UDP-N-acetylmuramoyl-tripeptide--D-alanyl-D-alanine ligase [Acidimicrobiales bacterium]|nr:UDP-N-acetylmuramoyl-tripeptide--D-alanyl-D-alanine ligase [Acidimicrobiales bacterium]